MATIKEIAQRAGVSTTTVSNVIHGKTKKVSPANIQKIENLIREKDLICLRHEEELLTEGDYQLLLPEDEKIFAYLRTSDKEQWIVVANLSEDTVSTEGLEKYVSDKEDIKIANYKDRTGIKADLRPYEAFMMRIR